MAKQVTEDPLNGDFCNGISHRFGPEETRSQIRYHENIAIDQRMINAMFHFKEIYLNETSLEDSKKSVPAGIA